MRIRLLLFTAILALSPAVGCSMLGGSSLNPQQQQAAMTLCQLAAAANPAYASACTLLGTTAAQNPVASNTLPPLAVSATGMICSANSTDPHIMAGCLILQSLETKG